jgi:protoheme IX farnesyltransferase
MVVADRGHIPGLALVVATLLGGTCAAGGANALNMYIDRDIDRLMARTWHRPLVKGEVRPNTALVFALTLEVVAFFDLWLLVNLLSAVLAASAAAFYIGVYTLWLKRTSRQNIVIGGAAGAVPVLVGWSAVTGSLGAVPILLFALIFFWTPPHFWALAVKYRKEYEAAGVPMMPTVNTLAATAHLILVYTFITVAISGAVVPVAHFGVAYMASAGLVGAIFVVMAAQLNYKPNPKTAMRLFGFSITYLSVIFVAMAIDSLVQAGSGLR